MSWENYGENYTGIDDFYLLSSQSSSMINANMVLLTIYNLTARHGGHLCT